MCSWYVYVYSAVTLLDVRSNATVHNVYSNAPDDKWWDHVVILLQMAVVLGSCCYTVTGGCSVGFMLVYCDMWL